MKTSEIREAWLAFFEKKGHTVVPSASLISDDPTLMFTIAGMVPFVPYLTGLVPAPFPRATSVQKCIRTLDIEEVGKTPRHGTFFQMNGNFSFGDYFKAEAIEFAWELLTTPEADGGFGFASKDLWVTVYEEDDEAEQLWLQTSDLPKERIQRLGRESNFWHTGQPGPAGPSSEIFFDRGPAYGADGGPATDDDRYVEIWNLVFMEYLIADVNSKTDFRIVSELPKKNIDTGMGLERVAFLKQGVENIYEIDEVWPMLDAAAKLTGKTYGANLEDDVRLRVIADHVRSALMLMSDGITPSNEGRGYILRRLMRRVVRAIRLLGFEQASFPVLFPASRDAMKASYPVVETDFGRISSIAYAEEDTFLKTLVSGTQILDQEIDKAQNQRKQQLSGDVAFLLHDTYGFPIDLTLEIAQEAGLDVNQEAFRTLMAEQRNRAKQDAKSKKKILADLSVYRAFRAYGETEFRGYTELETESEVMGLIRDGVSVTEAFAGDTVEVIVNETSLYAESGGQDSDHGMILGDGFELEVLDVQRPVPGLVSHLAKVVHGEVAVGQAARTVVDAEYRFGANQAHTATHIVHAALRELLGSTAHQSGSYNKSGYLRLDFSWNQSLSAETKSELEEIANLAIRADYKITTKVLPVDEAKALGAMALFGEKYGDLVRMVELNGAWSRELCAGTHVSGSAQIGLINLVSESSVGSTNRRVEALVGIDAFREFAQERALVQALSAEFKAPREQLAERIHALSADLRAAEKKIADYQQRELGMKIPELKAQQRPHGQYQVIAATVSGVPSADELRQLATQLKQQLDGDKGVVLLGAEIADKPVLIAAVTKDAVAAGAKAGALVRKGSQVLGGGGGGKDELAQGGGTDVTLLDEALSAAIGELG